MSKLTRRRFLKAGAAGGAAAGVALAAPGVAKADAKKGILVHIDAILETGPFPVIIDIDVAGTRDLLRGEGWDTDWPNQTSADGCIYTQQGSITGDMIHLRGKSIIATTDTFRDQEVTTEANMKTGDIDWTFGPFAFSGNGRIVVDDAKVTPKGSDDDD